MKAQIRELRPNEIDRFADLCATRMSRADAEARAAVVEFLAFSNPVSDGGPTYFVAVDGDRILGHLGRMPTEFFVQGRRHLAAFAHDLFVDPELQKGGRGFFLTMKFYQAVEKACASFCALVWTNEINVKIQQTRRYDELWAHRFVHLLGVEGKLDRYEERLGPLVGLVGHGARIATHMLDRALTFAAERRVVEVERFDERFDGLAERVGPRLGIAPVKDHRYLNWKYVDRPALDTVHFVAEGAPGVPRGFIVLTKHLTSGGTGTVLDLMAPPDDTSTLLALFGRALEYYRQKHANVVEAVATDPRVVQVLKRILFLPRGPLQPLFMANAARYSQPAFLHSLDHWHLCYGDSEGPH